MIEILQKFANLSVLVFVVSSMLAMGLSQRLRDAVAPLRQAKPVILALLVNFMLAPLLSVLLVRVIPLEPAHAIGLLLLGGAAGSPFLPKLTEIACGNLAYSVALMMLTMLGTILFMPLALPLFVPGLVADPLRIATPLVLLMLLPLVVGFAIAATNPPWKTRLFGIVQKFSNLSFIVFVALMVGLNLDTLLETIGSYAIGSYALFVLGMVGAGYLLGGKDKPVRNIFVLAAAQRNISATLVVAGASFDEPAITVMLVVASVVGMLMLLTLAKLMGRQAVA